MSRRSRKRRQYVGCTVESAPSGLLRLRYRFLGKRRSVGTRLADTPENRRSVELLAHKVGEAIRQGIDPAEVLQGDARSAHSTPNMLTVAEYYERWVAIRTQPTVRKAQARDYRKHIGGYVLPKLGALPIAELRATELLGLRAELFQRGLSVKFVKNIIGASLRAMLRDACEEEVLSTNPFNTSAMKKWPRVEVPGPDPFEEEERDKILFWFMRKVGLVRTGAAPDRSGRTLPFSYYAYAHTLFWTAMRPSEAAGLRWGDVDLARRVLLVRRSYHMGEYSGPKTASAVRCVSLTDATVTVLRQLQPLHVQPESTVFPNLKGTPIEPKNFSDIWYRALRAVGVRVRGIYAMKDTYISLALTRGVNIPWLEQQTGVRYETIRRHYGRYMRSEGANELAKLEALAPELALDEDREGVSDEDYELKVVRGGGLEPPRPFGH